MKIKDIELCNFKQYYGKQNIEFAGYDTDSSENVTVVYGENGRGKTSLYRALMFALYGDKFLDQDKNLQGSRNKDLNPDLYIVNINALKEDFEAENDGVEAYVKVNFINDNIEYSLYRSMFGIQNSQDEIFEEDGKVKLTVKNEDGNTKVIEDKEKIEQKVNSILDGRVKSYFLFDGERIERLTKATKEQKEEVAGGIKNLLKIDELNCSIDALEKLKKKIRKELKKISTGDYRKSIEKLDKLDNKKETLEKDLDSLSEELKYARKQEKDIENELAKFDEYKDLIYERKSLKKRKDELTNDREELSDKIRNFNNKAIMLLADDILENVFADINNKDISGIDIKVKKKVVDRILNQMKCICGTNLNLDSKEHKALKEWANEPEENVVDDRIMDFRDELIKAREYISNNKDNCDELLGSFSKLDGSIEEINSRLEQLDAEIDDVSDEEFEEKKEYRKKLIKDISNFEQEIENKEKKISEVENKIQQAENKRKNLEKQQNIKNEFSKKLELTENTLAKLEKIKNLFISEVKDDLEEEATAIFKRLIDSATKDTFKRIIVNDDYSLEILDWNNRPFLANISAGQRQVMSLAFITALAKIAGGKDILEVPLFMDTPFGRLSGNHRDNLLKEIPELSPQWILLATDTEFTRVEAEELRKSGNWGKVYKLELIEDGYTKLKEVSVNQFKPKR
ncbi:AAA family ATPase [Acetohalobium arabaticum]|uniref:Nuclease SbcCD subunit C n=1 Tax=Acetohalobium arabaticum (strain ATCC 49924 / DSM 5501 / Z-7288) TaxID=574087 RepID=D9QVD1_ACEAZ|nr:AAA family ATPase [Acetohalobium arabaticum]ADL12190.1 SMC domain protein [Acetohalobium arabaticum DSM 5501]